MVLLSAGARFGLRPALPFVGGIILGKQLVIWPVGFGVMAVLVEVPVIFTILKFASAAYILYLAWRIAGSRIAPAGTGGIPPRFASGLIVHPLNPKAWAMIAAGFTGFTDPGTPVLVATLSIALCLLAVQILFHPLWCWGGERLAEIVAGTALERGMMVALALLTVAMVFLVLAKGA